jgi:hypothetical protein
MKPEDIKKLKKSFNLNPKSPYINKFGMHDTTECTPGTE